jgi:hypothetical protein
MISIRDRIIGSPELQDARAARDLDALAAGLNAQGVSAVQSRFVTMRTVTAECSDADGIITALTGAAAISPSVAEMLGFLRDDTGMDVGHPNTQAKINAMAGAGALTQAQANQIKALALLPVVVTRADVEAAMYNPDGTEK